nr:hypothetical protein CFP56_63943 [Quercus suber]
MSNSHAISSCAVALEEHQQRKRSCSLRTHGSTALHGSYAGNSTLLQLVVGCFQELDPRSRVSNGAQVDTAENFGYLESEIRDALRLILTGMKRDPQSSSAEPSVDCLGNQAWKISRGHLQTRSTYPPCMLQDHRVYLAYRTQTGTGWFECAESKCDVALVRRCIPLACLRKLGHLRLFPVTVCLHNPHAEATRCVSALKWESWRCHQKSKSHDDLSCGSLLWIDLNDSCLGGRRVDRAVVQAVAPDRAQHIAVRVSQDRVINDGREAFRRYVHICLAPNCHSCDQQQLRCEAA